VAQACFVRPRTNPSRVQTCQATRRLAKTVFSAKGRGIHLKEGSSTSAESAIHFRHWFDPPSLVETHLRRLLKRGLNAWGDVPGWS
jgi:hypothetical protein